MADPTHSPVSALVKQDNYSESYRKWDGEPPKKTLKVCLDPSLDGYLQGLIVYIPYREDTLSKKRRGTFEYADITKVIPGTLLSNKGIEMGILTSRHNHRVYSVYLDHGDGTFYRTRLFSRVSIATPKKLLDDILRELNYRMGRCHPCAKDYDAEDAIAQDIYRILRCPPGINVDKLHADVPSGIVDTMVPGGFNELKKPIIKKK